MKLKLAALIITAAIATGIEASSENKATASASRQEVKQQKAKFFIDPQGVAHTVLERSCANAGCSKTATKHCSRCKVVDYCSQDCQKTHWSTHKTTCGQDNKDNKAVEQQGDEKTDLSALYAQLNSDNPDLAALWITGLKIVAPHTQGTPSPANSQTFLDGIDRSPEAGDFLEAVGERYESLNSISSAHYDEWLMVGRDLGNRIHIKQAVTTLTELHEQACKKAASNGPSVFDEKEFSSTYVKQIKLFNGMKRDIESLGSAPERDQFIKIWQAKFDHIKKKIDDLLAQYGRKFVFPS